MSERLAATGRIAHTIAHEINNPLEALSNLLYIVQQDTSAAISTQAYLQQASLELDRISQITKQILAYHRDSKQPIPVTADDMIDSVLAMFRVPILSNRVTLVKRLESTRLISVQPGEMQASLWKPDRQRNRCHGKFRRQTDRALFRHHRPAHPVQGSANRP